MAENNRNWRDNQYQQSNDWEQNRNRYNQEDELRNQENRYGNASYGANYNQDMNRSYGNNQYSNISGGRDRQNEGYGSGDYGGDYDQTNYRGTSQPNWWNSEYMPQQARGERRNEDYDHYGQQQDWRRRDMDYGTDYGGGRRNIGSNYNQDRNRSYGDEYGSSGYNRPYRSSGNYGGGYGEGMGNIGGYSGGNYGSRNDLGGSRNYGNMGRERDRGWWDRTKDEVSSWFGDDDAERRRRQDEMSGPHRGKGPKDYRRSEDRIREDVCDRLADDDRIDASDIKVQIQNDEVILSGTVHSREEKRRAEDLVESISGVRNVENRLKIGHTENTSFDRYTGTTSDVSGIGRESGTTNEVLRNTEKNKNK